MPCQYRRVYFLALINDTIRIVSEFRSNGGSIGATSPRAEPGEGTYRMERNSEMTVNGHIVHAGAWVRVTPDGVLDLVAGTLSP